MKRSARTPRRRLGVDEAGDRVAELRKRPVPAASRREDLDKPIPPAIQVATEFPNHTLSLLVGGTRVSWATVVDFRQQIGHATVRMGGIAGVGTHAEHRFQGHSRRLLEASLRWMRRRGFDTAMLYGIPCFYPKFGFAPAFPSVAFEMAVRDAESVAPRGHSFVGFRAEAHLDAVLRMYHANNAGRTGPTRRVARHWKPFRKGATFSTKAVCRVAFDRRGAAAGYVVYDAQHPSATVIEVGHATPSVFPDLLRDAARHAWRERVDTVRLLLPEDEAFIEYCKPLGLKKEVGYRRDGGAMVRMVNVPSALRKVAGELGSRMTAHGRLNLLTNLDSVGLAWSGGQLRVGEPEPGAGAARLPQWALAQFLYGYRSAASLAAAGVLRASGRTLGILDEMFPVTPHFHYAADHF